MRFPRVSQLLLTLVSDPRDLWSANHGPHDWCFLVVFMLVAIPWPMDRLGVETNSSLWRHPWSVHSALVLQEPTRYREGRVMRASHSPLRQWLVASVTSCPPALQVSLLLVCKTMQDSHAADTIVASARIKPKYR